MRLYHKLYRRKNPPPKRRALSGVRKEVYDDLMALMRVHNPDGAKPLVPIARIRRGEALDPRSRIVMGPAPRKEAAEIEREKKRERALKKTLKKLAEWEEEEKEERKERAAYEKWIAKKEREELRKLGKTVPLRRAMLRKAAARELAASEAWRKEKGIRARTRGEKAQYAKEVAAGVAAKWNLLGELNRRIAEGKRALIPLRNTVAAELEGRITGEQLDYTVREALAELTAAELRGIKKFFAEMPKKEKPRKIRGWPVAGEEFVARKVFEPTDPRAELLLGLSAPQVAAVKDEIRKWHTKRMAITKEDRRIIAKDPQVQRAFLKQLKHQGIPITRDELETLSYENPKEVAMIVAAAVSKDPEVVKAIEKMQLSDRIRAHVADLPEVRKARAKYEKAVKHEAMLLDTLNKALERERMAGGTLGSKQPIVLEREAAARKEAEEYAKEVDPRAVTAARQREIPKDRELWDSIALGLASEAQKLRGDNKKRGAKIENVIKKCEKILKRYKSVKKLKIVPYLPPSIWRADGQKTGPGKKPWFSLRVMKESGVKKAEELERERLVLFDDDYAKAALKKFQSQTKAALKKFQKTKPAGVKVKVPEIKTVKQYREHLLRNFREQVRAKTGNFPSIKTLEQYREYFARRLYDTVTTRWRNVLMAIYERKGGKYLTPAERRHRERMLKKEIGEIFPMGGGLRGVILKTNGKFKWKISDADGLPLMWDTTTTHATASRQIVKGHRAALNIFREAYTAEPGFDYLDEKDRKWLSSNKPGLDLRLKKILWASVGEVRDVETPTIKWLAEKEMLEEPMPIKAEGYVTAKSCTRMKVKDKRVIPGKGFKIFVERKADRNKKKRYEYHVVTSKGDKSATYRVTECKDVMRRAPMIAGAIEAGKKIVAAASNPASLKRLENSARRYFRKKNPIGGGVALPRRAAEVGAIEDLSAMIRLPAEPDEAYRLGYYAGIIKGIDTCGVQNFIKRRKLRKEFQQRLLDAVVAHQEMLTERAGRGRRGLEEPEFP